MANVIDLIRADHMKVRKLFEEAKLDIPADRKKTIANVICLELHRHAQAEEAIVYPLLTEDTREHAMGEHKDIQEVCSELEANTTEDPTELLQKLEKVVIHHIMEEENTALLEVGRSGEDLEEKGQEFQNLKDVI